MIEKSPPATPEQLNDLYRLAQTAVVTATGHWFEVGRIVRITEEGIRTYYRQGREYRAYANYNGSTTAATGYMPFRSGEDDAIMPLVFSPFSRGARSGTEEQMQDLSPACMFDRPQNPDTGLERISYCVENIDERPGQFVGRRVGVPLTAGRAAAVGAIDAVYVGIVSQFAGGQTAEVGPISAIEAADLMSMIKHSRIYPVGS